MNWRVLVHTKESFADHHGDGVKKEARLAGVGGVNKARVGQAYELTGSIPEPTVKSLADRLLADPVTQTAVVLPADRPARLAKGRRAEIWFKKGVADPVADTVRLAAADLGVKGLDEIRSGRVFDFHGSATPAAIRRFCEDHLMNPLVQTVEVV